MKTTEMRYCQKCDESIPVTVTKTRHVLHGVLSFFTAGAWLIVWLICFLVANNDTPTCMKCGTVV